MKPLQGQWSIEIESFTSEGGGRTLLRPIPGQRFPVELLVEGNKSLAKDYPVGSRFKVQVTPSERASGGRFLYTSWQWDVVFLTRPDAE